MQIPGDRWLDPIQRQRQFLDTEQPDRPFYFGFRKVAADDKSEKVRRHFDSVAHCYDFMNTFLSLGIHYLWKKKAIRMMGLRPGDSVLDVCGGTGDLSVLASRVVGPTGRVVLFDMNWKMITAGKPNLAQKPSGRRIRFVQPRLRQHHHQPVRDGASTDQVHYCPTTALGRSRQRNQGGRGTSALAQEARDA